MKKNSIEDSQRRVALLARARQRERGDFLKSAADFCLMILQADNTKKSIASNWFLLLLVLSLIIILISSGDGSNIIHSTNARLE